MRAFAVLLFAVSAFAQAPSFLVATGATFSRYASPETAGWISLGVQTGGATSKTYSFTTADITVRATSLRTGVAFLALQSGKFYFLGTADAGGTSSATSTVGSFSGGPMVAWRIRKTFLIGRLRMIAITGQPVRPSYEFGIGWTP